MKVNITESRKMISIIIVDDEAYVKISDLRKMKMNKVELENLRIQLEIAQYALSMAAQNIEETKTKIIELKKEKENGNDS
jgi:hypothetical protein